MLLGFYIVRILLDKLGAQYYGMYCVAINIITIALFLVTVFTVSAQRFFAFELGNNNIHKIKILFGNFNLVSIFSIIISILFSEIFILFFNGNINIDKNELNLFINTFNLLMLSLSLTAMQNLYVSLMSAYEDLSAYSLISIVDILLKVFIIFLINENDENKIIEYSFWLLLQTVFVTIIYIFYTYKKYSIKFYFISFEKILLKDILIYNSWNTIGNLAVILCRNGIGFLLSIFFYLSTVTAYNVSLQIHTGIMLFVASFQKALTPSIIKLYAQNEIIKLKNLLYLNSKINFMILWMIALPIFIYIDDILSLWLIDTPQNVNIFVRLFLLQALVYSLDMPFVAAIQATGKIREISLTGGFILLLAFPVSFIFYKFGFEMTIGVIVYIVASFLCFMVEIFYLKKWLEITYKEFFLEIFLKVLISAILSYIGINFIASNLDNNFINFVLVFIVSIFVNLGIYFFIILNQKERFFVITIIQKMKKFV